MPEEKEYLTKEKFDELSAELEYLKKTKRKEVADSLEYAKSMGDLSENAEYQEARDMQSEVEERVSKLENILKNAEIMEAHRGNTVGIGAKVVIIKKGDKEAKSYIIVGSEEADVSLGKISNHSPLGEAMMGKKKGDSFDFKTPKGLASYTILEVK